MKTFFVRSIFLALPLAVLGCNGKPLAPPIPAAGTVVSFTATPRELAAAGEQATLSWMTEHATFVHLEHVGIGPIAIDSTAAAGTAAVTLTRDALFVLTVRGEGGTDSASTQVRVKGGAVGLVFDAVPRVVAAGGSSTLVWSAPGAVAVTLKEVGGEDIGLGGQRESGSVRVSPLKSTSYELDADGRKVTVAVEVGIAIDTFALEGPSPLPGELATLTWRTSGGTRLTIAREGAAGVLLTETDVNRIAEGTFKDLVPASTPIDGLLHYTLVLEHGTSTVSRSLTVRVGGSVKIDLFEVPATVRASVGFGVHWKTSGGERLELWTDGVLVFVAPNAAAVAQGTYAPRAPATGLTTTRLVVTNARGAVAQLEKSSQVLGPPSFTSFTANLSTVAAGGSPVVLSWNVTNARHVRITDNGQRVFEASGATLEQASATVFPNRALTTYVLEVDNGAGDAIVPQSLNVAVTSPAVLTFSAVVPAGGTSSITGHTVVGGTTVFGLPNVKKNVAGDAFVDISDAGQDIELVSTDTTATVLDIGAFATRIYGQPVVSNTISVSPDGYLVFSALPQTGPSSPTTTAIGQQLFPLTIAPVLRDLEQGDGKVSWRVDTVAGDQRLIVQWTAVEQYFTPANKLTFQLQVYGRGKVVFAYQTLPPGFAFAYGVVNSSESQVLLPATAPIPGDVFTFFTETALPLPIKVELPPYEATVNLPSGYVIVQGSGALSPNQLAITEINPHPAPGVSAGEWFEITNYTGAPFDLNGWTLELGGALTHSIATSVIVPANGRLVVAQSADLGDPTAGITAGYTYGAASPSFLMPDGSGALSLSISGTPYTRILWDAVTLPDAGVAVRGDRPTAARVYAGGAAQTICSGQGGPQYGAAAQTGTPGAPNPVCFPYTLTALDAGSFEPLGLNAGTTVILLGDAGTPATDNAVYPVALPSPVKVHGQSFSNLFVSTNGWISTTSTTLPVAVNKTVPSGAAPAGSIAPFWDDLSADPNLAGGGIYTLRRDPDGVAANGDEYTIVSWEGFRVGSTAGQRLNFQVKFFENGNLEYHYGAMIGGIETTHRGATATSWLEDALGKSALPINIESATAPGIRPDSAYRFTYTP